MDKKILQYPHYSIFFIKNFDSLKELLIEITSINKGSLIKALRLDFKIIEMDELVERNIFLSPFICYNINDDQEVDLDYIIKYLEFKNRVYQNDYEYTIFDETLWLKISITDEKLPSFKETKMSKEVKIDSERKDSYYRNEKNKRYYSTKVEEKKITFLRDLPQINKKYKYLPPKFNPYLWPNVIFKECNEKGDLYFYYINEVKLLLIVTEDFKYKKLFYKNELIESVIDVMDNDLLIRYNGANILKYKNGLLITKEKKYKKNIIKQNKKTLLNSRIYNLYTLDIECLNINGQHIPYALGIYTDNEFKMYYGLNCINEFLDSLNEYNKDTYFYIHNLARYDSKFLLEKIIEKDLDLSIIPSGSSSFSITAFIIKYLYNKKNIVKIHFLDSYKYFPFSLSRISKSFKLNIEKLPFPYRFMDCKTKLDYIGSKPSINYYENLDKKLYEVIPEIWNAKKETEIYLKRDVELLYKIKIEFKDYIINEFGVDIANTYSLPGLAKLIFRTKFYDEEKHPIVKLSHYVEDDIRKAYYGGIVEVYKPKINNGYLYDVNSLYPTAMMNNMPLGEPRLIKGQFNFKSKKGFVYVKVKAPNISIPYLPTRCHNTGGLITPIGNWSGWYFIPEIEYAESLGYKFEYMNKAYIFDIIDKPFTKYIETFYERKKNSTDIIEKNLSKLFLNSLYGRFGMKRNNKNLIVLDNNQLLDYIKKNCIIKEVLDITDNKKIYSHLKEYVVSSSNVAIAAAITAYSRIYIDQFKRIENNEPFYTDTDSVVLSKPLDNKFIGDELGLMKLEAIIQKGLFIGPKTYGYYNEKGLSIVKVKGFNSGTVKYEDLEELLVKNTYKNYPLNIFKVIDFNIRSLTLNKKLTTTINNKRIALYNNNNILVDTKPISLNDSINLDSKPPNIYSFLLPFLFLLFLLVLVIYLQNDLVLPDTPCVHAGNHQKININHEYNPRQIRVYVNYISSKISSWSKSHYNNEYKILNLELNKMELLNKYNINPINYINYFRHDISNINYNSTILNPDYSFNFNNYFKFNATHPTNNIFYKFNYLNNPEIYSQSSDSSLSSSSLSSIESYTKVESSNIIELCNEFKKIRIS